MSIKIFCLNSNGKIELSKEELEKILNDAKKEGYDEGYAQEWRERNFYYPYRTLCSQWDTPSSMNTTSTSMSDTTLTSITATNDTVPITDDKKMGYITIKAIRLKSPMEKLIEELKEKYK